MKSYQRISSIILCILCFFLLLPQATQADIEEMQSSTVLITCGDLNAGSFGIGTGFVIGNSDHVVTNHHVIACGEGQPVNIILTMENIIPVTVIWASEVKDLAVLKTEVPLNRPAVRFTKEKDVKVSDTVYVMGFPGAASPNFLDLETFTTVKVAKGIISAKVRSIDGVALYQTDAPINPGNSGGPLFTEHGQVIGINSMASLVPVAIEGQERTDRVRLGDNIGWSIQANELLVELDQLGIPYKVEGRIENRPVQGSSALNIMTFILVLLAVVLAAGALILSFTKKGRVIVKGVSQRILPASFQMKPAAAPVLSNPIASNPINNQNPSPRAFHIPYLRGINGPYSRQKFKIQQPITIGRNPSTSQLIISSHEISGSHCQVGFDYQTKLFYITDLQSTNGTFLENGQRLQAHRKNILTAGQIFYISNQGYSFEVILENS